MDLRKYDNRVRLIDHINSRENIERKERSFKTSEIYNDNLDKYVKEYLEEQFNKKTVAEMPIVSSVNISRRLCKEEAKIYTETPTREFTDLNDDQIDAVTRIYESMKADYTLSKANEYYKLQNQCLLQVIPKDGKLTMRLLKQHNYDPIVDPNDPESAIGYVISTFDRNLKIDSNDINEDIGDEDDYMASLKRYVVWTKTRIEDGEIIEGMNFIMNDKGEVLSEDTVNPIGVLPFIDISAYKDFSYFASESDLVSNFGIQLCGALTDLLFVSRMQGWSQAYLKAPEDFKAENMSIGPTKIIHLPTGDGLNQSDPEFGFASPNSDLQGSIQAVEFLLKCFLTSRGLSTSTVSGGSDVEKFSSGIERLLAKLDRAEASKEDYHLFEEVEDKLYQLIKVWHNTLEGDQLRDEFKANEIDMDSKVAVGFKKPEMFQSRSDKLDYNIKKLELGLGSRTTALMDIEEVSREEAEEMLKTIDNENYMSSIMTTEEQ